MKAMKRFGQGLAVFCALLLAGCTSKDTGDRVTITYQTMEALPQQRQALAKLVSEFEKTHPGIHVKVQTSPSGFQKLAAQLAGGDAPDVFYYVSDRLPLLVHRGAVLDLNTFLEKDASPAMDSYYAKVLDSCRLEKGLYCFPFHFSTDVLFYNKDLFDRAGLAYPDETWTWGQFAEAAKRLTVRDANGKTLQYGTLQPRPVLLIRSFGGEIFTPAQPPVCVIDSPASQKGLEFLQRLTQEGSAPQTAVLRDIEVMDGVTLFSTGRVGMLLGRTYMLVSFGNINAFEWDVALVPQGEIRYSRLAVGGNCISKSTRHPEAAWEFVKFFSGPRGSEIMGGFRNGVPALKSVAESPVFLHAPPSAVKIFIDSLASSRIENPGLMHWQEYVDKVIQPTVEGVLVGALSTQEALKTMQTKGEAILQEEVRVKPR